jgi:hypothetical protein
VTTCARPRCADSRARTLCGVLDPSTLAGEGVSRSASARRPLPLPLTSFGAGLHLTEPSPPSTTDLACAALEEDSTRSDHEAGLARSAHDRKFPGAVGLRGLHAAVRRGGCSGARGRDPQCGRSDANGGPRDGRCRAGQCRGGSHLLVRTPHGEEGHGVGLPRAARMRSCAYCPGVALREEQVKSARNARLCEMGL